MIKFNNLFRIPKSHRPTKSEWDDHGTTSKKSFEEDNLRKIIRHARSAAIAPAGGKQVRPRMHEGAAIAQWRYRDHLAHVLRQPQEDAHQRQHRRHWQCPLTSFVIGAVEA